jgi:phosphatidylserine/phosphatidylglycerophosphate/cardiolipin synthase-like enzyme/uncharacterized membrane protein YdjX (TVP38/TMEM64 family)
MHSADYIDSPRGVTVLNDTAFANAHATNNSIDPEQSMLRPGDNCWRIETATRLQFLIDGEEYFTALRATLLRARHSIYIVGWDIDSRVALPRGDNDELPEPLGQFLDALARARPDLHVYVLSWDYAVLFALEREWLPAINLNWRTHRRVHFRLDNRHPTGASHHQKIVVVDDQVAFVGGIDITRCRWDSSAHVCDSDLRRDADGTPYAPFHDIQAMVEGPVAAALGELARTRWQRASGRKPAQKKQTTVSPWPPAIAPALQQVTLAIARTEPAFERYVQCSEIQRFYLAAIAAAQRSIFFENQYFSSNAIATALKQRLTQSDGPEIVIITPLRESGWLEETTMGVLRARLYERLRADDRAARFHPYCPILENENNDAAKADAARGLNVHSKLMIVDDEYLTLGSANLSNRSMNLDTECNLILAAACQGEQAQAVRAAIANVRNRLLAEHLAVAPEQVAAASAEHGLVGAIESLRGERRTLVPANTTVTTEFAATIMADPAFADPAEPLEPERVLSNYIHHRDRKPVLSHTALVGIVAIVLAALALLWRETPLHDYLNIRTALAFIENLQRQPLTPLWVMLLYVIAGFVFVPVVLLIAATGIVFGPWLGIAYALSGSMLSAASTYWIGAKSGGGIWQRLFSRRLHRLRGQLQRQGLLAVAVVRAVPIAPFTLINLIAGAAQVRWRDYLIGTLIGMLPGIVMTVLFVDRAAAALRRPSLGSIATLVLTMGIIVGVSLLLQHWLRGRASGKRSS